jgi:hypothetical protein
MPWTSTGDAQHLVITFKGLRKRQDVFHLLGGAILFIGLRYLVESRADLAVARAVGLLWPLYILFRRFFGTAELTVDPEIVILNRRLFGIGRKMNFSKADVEGLGFVVDPQQNDTMLGLRTRTHIFATPFAHGVTSDEATAMFGEIKRSGSWIAEFIRPVGTQLFE